MDARYRNGPGRAALGGSRGWAAWALLLGLWLCTAVAAAQDNALTGLEVNALSGNRAQVLLTFAEPVAEPGSFAIEDPARLVLDFPGVENRLTDRSRAVSAGALHRVIAVAADGRTRVVMNLAAPVPHDVRVEGERVLVTLGAPGDAGPAAADGGARIANVDFRRADEHTGRVLIELSDPTVPVNVRRDGDRLIAEFQGVELPESLRTRLDVTDFGTRVQDIELIDAGADARVSIGVESPYDYLAYQMGSTYTLEIGPPKAEAAAPEDADDKRYTGERLSFNFQDIPVRSVLQLIAEFTGLNIVVSDAVQGNVTLRLNDVPWDQALDLILESKGLGMRQSGNVIRVAPAEEIARQAQQEEEIAPLQFATLQINYAKAADIAALLQAEDGQLLSARGSVKVDQRTNTLLIRATTENLAQIRRLVTTLDRPVRQVLIESRIVIASDDFRRELGTRFGVVAASDGGDQAIIGGSSDGVDDALDAGVDLQDVSLTDRLNVNLPVANPAGSLALALLGSDYLVDLELSALQAEGRGEVISNPRVITANQQEAVIKQGVEIPYQEATSSGATNVSFKEAVLSLKVTPQITPDDRVLLNLVVNKDSVGQLFLGVPSINTREVSTQVLVSNGETLVLGGIFERARSNEVDKVPFLGDLPGVGALFRHTTKVDEKAELLIFVTPKIVDPALALP